MMRCEVRRVFFILLSVDMRRKMLISAILNISNFPTQISSFLQLGWQF